MAQTESRTGFRLPWSTDDRAPTPERETLDDVEQEHAASNEAESGNAPPSVIDTAPNEKEASVQSTTVPAALTSSVSGSPKKPTKFLADLTRAMQVAAEAARASTLEQFQAEAKTHVEGVHTNSAEAAAEIRKNADDDVAQIRDWSKAEIARVREETDRKITNRKADLDEDLEAHAARIERDIERVQTRVAAFEAEMARFFERLLQEDDPAEFAALAENMPEPPPFDGDELEPPAATAPTRSDWLESPLREGDPSSAPVDLATDVPDAVENVSTPTAPSEQASVSEATSHDAPSDNAPADDEPDDDLRLAALGLNTSLDAAEAEAQAAAEATTDDDIPTIGDDDLAARIAGLVPSSDAPDAESDPQADTALSSQVVVTGLVSVASIAGFKRQLGRVPGVQSVGVSSGPEGEFLFAVAHGPEVDLAEAISTLSGFEARVTGSGEGVVNVSARDPESES